MKKMFVYARGEFSIKCQISKHGGGSITTIGPPLQDTNKVFVCQQDNICFLAPPGAGWMLWRHV